MAALAMLSLTACQALQYGSANKERCLKYSIFLDSFGDLLNIAQLGPLPSPKALEAMREGISRRNDAAGIQGYFKSVRSDMYKALEWGSGK